MKIAFGCDHGGFVLKAEIIEYLEKNGHEIIDFGINDDHSVDYPDYGLPVAECVSAGEADFGIIACGTGHRYFDHGEQGPGYPLRASVGYVFRPCDARA